MVRSHCMRRDDSRLRRGLSFVEFVGCLVALGSGVALGSFYLGVDMKTLFIGVMEEAEIVEPGYFEGGQAADSTDGQEDPNGAERAAGEAQDGADPNDPNAKTAGDLEESALKSVLTSIVEAMPEQEKEPEIPEEERIAATLAYWEALSAAIKQEVKERNELPDLQSNWQLFDYLSHRAEGHEKAIAAIKEIPTLGVDKELWQHGEQVRSWHAAGAKLYRRAVSLLTSSPSDQFAGPSAQSWQSSATQHRMEEKLVRDKHFSISNYLNHTYGAAGSFHPAY